MSPLSVVLTELLRKKKKKGFTFHTSSHIWSDICFSNNAPSMQPTDCHSCCGLSLSLSLFSTGFSFKLYRTIWCVRAEQDTVLAPKVQELYLKAVCFAFAWAGAVPIGPKLTGLFSEVSGGTRNNDPWPQTQMIEVVGRLSDVKTILINRPCLFSWLTEDTDSKWKTSEREKDERERKGLTLTGVQKCKFSDK